jgi:hypothetical protein
VRAINRSSACNAMIRSVTVGRSDTTRAAGAAKRTSRAASSRTTMVLFRGCDCGSAHAQSSAHINSSLDVGNKKPVLPGGKHGRSMDGFGDHAQLPNLSLREVVVSGTNGAGLLASRQSHSPSRITPVAIEWTSSTCNADWPLTVAGPRRFCTGLPNGLRSSISNATRLKLVQMASHWQG